MDLGRCKLWYFTPAKKKVSCGIFQKDGSATLLCFTYRDEWRFGSQEQRVPRE